MYAHTFFLIRISSPRDRRRKYQASHPSRTVPGRRHKVFCRPPRCNTPPYVDRERMTLPPVYRSNNTYHTFSKTVAPAGIKYPL